MDGIENGYMRFSSENITHDDMYSKFNFCFINYMYAKETATENQEYHKYDFIIDTMEKFCTEYLDDSLFIKDVEDFFKKEINNWAAYVDHQSCYYEEPEVAFLFDSVSNLEKFIFNDKSSIHVYFNG